MAIWTIIDEETQEIIALAEGMSFPHEDVVMLEEAGYNVVAEKVHEDMNK